MKISIITVCFNSVKTIRSAIESVVSQSYNDIEYIIVDGASNDSTMSVISEYQSYISTIISEPDSGLYEAMNKGINAATGDVIGILNSDDVFVDEYVLSSVAEEFQGNEQSDIVFGDIVFVRPSDPNTIIRYYSSKNFRPWKMRFGWMPPHPATFFKKEVYDNVGRYSLEYKISADYELFVRAFIVHKYKFSRINQTLVRMDLGGVSSSGIKSNILLNLEIVRACRSNGVYTNIFLVLSKIPFKLFELIIRPRIQ